MNKMKSTIILLITLLTYSFSTQAQCLTDQMNKKFIEEHPELVVDLNSLSLETQNTRRATKYIIPVVFHVVHTNGPENISKEQILEQMQILNEDFSATNPNKADIRNDFKALAGDMEIEFRLARIDPDGNCTDGIHRVYNATHSDVRDEVKTAVPGWDYRKYLNIWTVSSISTEGQGTTLGYAYLPYATSSTKDGIVMRADAVGDYIGTARYEGSTLTHEVGHYLGLLHTFQGECDDEDLNFAENNLGLCTDDTPPVATSTTNANCGATSNSCSNDFPDKLDMWENYMDYSDGHCQAMFTPCQIKLAHYFLESNSLPRKTLYQESNLIATGVMLPNTVTAGPVANFSVSSTIVCVGQEVQFYDESCKQTVESRKWDLAGSSIASTNAENPIVTYNTPGVYEVKLTVGNSSGEDSKTMTNYINVRPNVAYDKFIQEDVEELEINKNGWTSPEVGGVKWEVTTEAAFSGSKSLKIPINANSNIGTKYSIDLPAIDLRRYENLFPKISFMVGYLRASATNSETLRILVSRDCGETFEQKKVMVGSGLASSFNYETNHIPQNSSDWKRFYYSLNEFQNDSNVIIRIEVESGAGNSVYIDDINVSQFFTSISDPKKAIGVFEVFPNPNDGNMQIELTAESNENIEIALLDLTGKKVSTLYNGETIKGINTFEVSNNDALSNGIYYLQVNINGVSSYRKISIIK